MYPNDSAAISANLTIIKSWIYQFSKENDWYVFDKIASWVLNQYVEIYNMYYKTAHWALVLLCKKLCFKLEKRARIGQELKA